MSNSISDAHTSTHFSSPWEHHHLPPPYQPFTNAPPAKPMFDLQDILMQYKSQPELLKLILSSKVEEDKRRAEEAKLRAKELDLYLERRQSQAERRDSSESHSSWRKRRASRSIPSSSSPSYAPYPLPSSSRHLNPSDDYHERRNSAAAAMVAMRSQSPTSPSYAPASPSQNSLSSFGSFSSPDTAQDLYENTPSASFASSSEASSPSPSSPVFEHESRSIDGESHPKRRREMQAITKIVETREFPYNDNYFWKNNGNTTQRKTGLKSIYYKCSNSAKGCPVNKTVTERCGGEYLIKYRGEHLRECGRVERVCEL